MTTKCSSGYHLLPKDEEGDTTMAAKDKTSRNEGFLEKLGDKDIELGDFKVDDLRKIASGYSISGSHDMHKEDLVQAINKARRTDSRQESA